MPLSSWKSTESTPPSDAFMSMYFRTASTSSSGELEMASKIGCLQGRTRHTLNLGTNQVLQTIIQDQLCSSKFKPWLLILLLVLTLVAGDELDTLSIAVIWLKSPKANSINLFSRNCPFVILYLFCRHDAAPEVVLCEVSWTELIRGEFSNIISS